MTTVDIELQDPRGGKLVICGHNLESDGYVIVNTSGTLDSLDLARDGAETLVAWLRETFKLEQELEAYSSDVLRIVVPRSVNGLPHEVVWSGEGEPPAWFAGLAEIALTGKLSHRDLSSFPPEVSNTERVLEILEILHSTGVQSTSVTVVEDVRDLTNAQAKRGAEILTARLNKLHADTDTLKRELAGAIEQRDTLESQLATAREGLELARAQLTSPESGEPTDISWPVSVTRGVVADISKALDESAGQR